MNTPLSTPPLLSIENLKIEIRHPSFHIQPVKEVSLSVSAGEAVALVGKSGSGKSLTALSLLGLLPPAASVISGLVRFKGQIVKPSGEISFASLRGRHISMIFQEPASALNPVFSVGSQIRDVIQAHQSEPAGRARQQAIDLLQLVGLPHPAEIYWCYPHQLSGGMAQRVMIAMALSCRPELIIADEPTTALDVSTQHQILRLLSRLQKKYEFGLLFISHDLKLVARLANRIIVMRDGKVVEEGLTHEIMKNPVQLYPRDTMNNLELPPSFRRVG